jgi:hypothetical protein
MKRLIMLLICSRVAAADLPPSWLRLPEAGDPRPSDVSAWVLNNDERVTQVSEESIVYRYRSAVMYLTEAGVKSAQFVIPYTAGSSAVVSAKAWAMSPDGKKCREFGINDFVVSSPVSNMMWDLSKIIYFEAQHYEQPGWILAWDVEIRSDSSAFDIQWSPRSELPVRSATLELLPMAGGDVKWKAISDDLPHPIPGARGGLKWSLSNLAGYSQELPESAELNSMELRAYLLDEPSESKSWADVVRLARKEMDPKAVLTPRLQALAKGIAGTGGVWSRIEPICRFVQKEVTYLSVTIDSDSMAGYRPHPAGDVCDNRYGDCKDKATLLCTLLHSVGVDAHVVIVNSGLRRTNVIDWPSANFNHAIVAIPCTEPPPPGSTAIRVQDRDYLLFDPTDDRVPFGELPFGDMGGLALLLAPGVTTAVTIPMFPSDFVTVSSSVGIAMADDGSAKIDFTEMRYGLAAAAAITRDETQSLPERTGALEKRIQRRVPLISDLTWESGETGNAHDWTSKATFSAQYVGKRMTGGMYVGTDLLSVVPRTDPWDEDVEGWVSVEPGILKREISLDAPAGWGVAELPADWVLSSAAGEGSLHYSRVAGNAKGEMRIKIQGGVLDRTSYMEFRELLNASVAAERRPIVLRRLKPVAPAAPAPAAH